MLPSKIANWMIASVTGVPIKDNGCSLKAYRASLIKAVQTMRTSANPFLYKGFSMVTGPMDAFPLQQLAFARLLRSLTYGVSVVDPFSLMIAVAIVVAVASLATWLPARRAARIDPAEALRND